MWVDRAFSDLIGRIYDCSLDQGFWPVALEENCEALNGKFADLAVFDGLSGSMQIQAI